MGPYASFGIIQDFDETKSYNDEYNPEKYDCVQISDLMINKWWRELLMIKTYTQSFDRAGWALDRWGTTLIPPESLPAFLEILLKDKRADYLEEIEALIDVVREAIEENKFVIHYGV